jgi:ribulose-5-phosphate 4-epimerase/fuculose-1-phosphate aldolase
MSSRGPEAAQLCRLGVSLFQRGLTPGRTGNLSVRLQDDTILISPSGTSMGDLDPETLSRVSLDGAHLDGLPPSKETFLHLALYKARPQDQGVAHTHSTHAAAVSCLADLDDDNALPPLTAYYAMRVGRLPRLPYYSPGDNALGPIAQSTARSHTALLLSNHGPIASGRDLATAVDVIEEIEETSRLFLLLHGRNIRFVPAQ